MTTRKAIRADLVNVIFNGAGVRTLGYMPDQIPAPCATVSFKEMDPRMVFSEAKAVYPLTVRLWVPRNSERTGQNLLDDWSELSGSTSVVAAIQTSANWTQTIDFAQVVSIGAVQEDALGDEVFLTVDLDVEIVW